MTGVLEGIADLVFPPRCMACGMILALQGPLPFCPPCSEGIRLIRSPLCPRCGVPFPCTDGGDHLCGECLATPRPFAVARAVGLYEETLLTAIHHFKYRGRIGFGKVLGGIMADFAGSVWDMKVFSLIIPVPLHKKRLRERGFNQAVLLARTIAKRFDLPCDVITLRREVYTKPQVGLGHPERAVNVQGAFAVRKPERTAGQRILLVDDVYTTGSTLAECASALLDAGADSVAVLTLARALRDRGLPDLSTDAVRTAAGE
ncbi:MAG: ComF family protein [Thermodesulfobacteriota bacterium]